MNIKSNGSKWAGQAPDTVEQLLEVLKTETLEPSFERFGHFFYEEAGTWHAFGNFQSVSHVFNIEGTREELEPLRLAIQAARSRPEYHRAFAELFRDSPVCECGDRKGDHGPRGFCHECAWHVRKYGADNWGQCRKFRAVILPEAVLR